MPSKEEIKVTKEEFNKFIKNYPRPLEKNIANICEPPLLSYNDFSDGKVWPESIVASVVLDWSSDNGEIDEDNTGKFWEYYIKN